MARFKLLAVNALTCVVATAALVAIALLFTPVRSAHAYVDPSVVTYAIQTVAGVAVALSAVVGVAFRRTRKTIFRVLRIDENANKRSDPAWTRLPGDKANMTLGPEAFGHAALPGAGDSDAARGDRGYAPDLRRRIVTALAVVAFFVFTLFVVAPFEIIVGNEDSLQFGIDVLWPYFVGAALLIIVVGTVLLLLARGRAFNVLVMIVLTLGVCCYVQAMFCNGGLPAANGDRVEWTSFAGKAWGTLVLWLAIILVPTLASLRRRKLFQTVALVVSIALIIVQGVGVASLLVNRSSGNDVDGFDYQVTEDGMFTLSPQNNVVFFVLDTYDTEFLQMACSENPYLLDEFTGFTWYANSTGSMTPTRYGNVFLLTGVYPEVGENFKAFLGERYDRSTYLEDLRDAGYDLGIYSTVIGTAYLDDEQDAQLADLAFNIRDVDERKLVDKGGMLSSVYRCALYRDLPWLAKPFLWYYTDQVNQSMAAEVDDPALTTYVFDDGAWFAKLKESGLSIEDRGSTGSFRYIHLSGTHWPYSVDENGNGVGIYNASLSQQAQGSMVMVAYYIRQLKELGLYDDTTIIVTADHGDYYPIEGYLEKATTPIMLVKPAQSAEDDEWPLSISTAPVDASDALATVMAAIGGDPYAYGTPVYEIDPGDDRVRYYQMTTNDENGYDVDSIQYQITGDARDFDNWELTGHVWNVWGEYSY